jgi:putative ABC transport system ATP-binding protein
MPTRDSNTTNGMLLRDVRFSYGTDFALHIGELRLEAGEQAILCGRSGSGKSTLLNLIAGIDAAASGSILIGGEDILAARGHARDLLRGRRIGMIFQTFNLLHGFTALENVMVPLMLLAVPAHEMRHRAHDALSRLGIDRHDALVDTLSVGQQQRVAVARAVVTTPTLVLADEPTASLDPENAETAVRLIRAACSACGAALLMTSHAPALRSQFERAIDIRDFVATEVAR